MTAIDNSMNSIIAAIQAALGIDEGGFADMYFDGERWKELSDAIKDDDGVTVARILIDYANAERWRLENA